MRSALPILAAAALFAGPAFAETWRVTEGVRGASGQWNVTVGGGAIAGAGTMQDRGRTLSFKLAGQVKDGGYLIERVDVAPADKCSYVARTVGPSFTGTVICNGAQGPWRVERK